MKNETRIILTAFRNFLARQEIKDKMLTAVMPKDARLGDLSGKEVEVPLSTVFQGMTHKLSFEDMAKVLDDNNDVVCIFLEELFDGLHGYIPPTEEPDVSIKTKEKEVKDISKDLKGASNEDDKVE